MGSVYRPKGRTLWVLKYYRDGVAIKESSGTTNEKEAKRLLRNRETDVLDRSLPIELSIGRVLWDEAVDDLATDYSNKDRRSWDDTQRRVTLHLTPYFAGRRLATITAADVAAYVKHRKSQTYVPGAWRRKSASRQPRRHYSRAQINRELAVLKRIFRLEIELGKLAHRPHIAIPQETNARKGFFEVDQFLAVRARLSAPVDAIITFAYLTGWRIDSEVLPLEWRHIDFASGEVRLDAEMTKSAEGRVIVMSDDLRALLRGLDLAHAQRQKAGQLVPWVFVRMVALGRGGPTVPKRVTSIRKAWLRACQAAGLPGRIPHDFRRTAVRNYVRRGVSETTAMQLTGHKTRSVFKRYDIVSDEDRAAAAVRMSGQLSGAAGAEAVVVTGGKRYILDLATRTFIVEE